MVQWVKNLTATGQGAAEGWVRSSARRNGSKDLVLPQLQLGLNPWPRELPHVVVGP